MVCTSGRPRLTTDDDRRLFAESAGTCLLCNAPLFVQNSAGNRSISLAERAHIIAFSDIGPRADASISSEDRADISNLVLLCPSCHTTVDLAPEDFPTEDLRQRKAKRAQAVLLVGGTPVFDEKGRARCAIKRLLLRNRVLFEQKGPDEEDGGTDSLEAAREWTRCVLEEIIPNSRVLLAIVELNARFASEADLLATERLRQHVDDLERKHRGATLLAPAARFPAEANYLFGDNHR